MELVCREDLDAFASELDDELEEFAQDLDHRIDEDYGSNPDNSDRGVGLSSRLSGTDAPSLIGRLIEADLSKDERVLSCTAKVTRSTAVTAEGVVARVAIEVTTTAGLLKLRYEMTAAGTMTGGVVQ